jgi:hypothetical protein
LTYNLFEIAIKRVTHFTFYVYPIKDVLFLLVMLSWLSARRQRAQNLAKPPLVGTLKVYLSVVALQVFNPYLMNPIVGLMGWHNDFIYILLYFVAFDLMSEWLLVRRLFWLTAWLGILSAIGCFIEQTVGPEEVLKSYPMFVDYLSWDETGRMIYRPVSLSVFMEVFAIAIMISSMTLSSGLKNKLLLLGGIFACGTANILHGVRIAWVVAAFFVAGFTLLNWRRNILYVAILLTCLAGAVSAAIDLTKGDILIRLQTMETPTTTFSESRSSGLMALPQVILRYPFGQGIGWQNPGLRFTDFSFEHTALYGFHNYITDLAAQLSLLGPVLVLSFCFGLLRRGLRAYRSLREKEARAYMSCMLALFGAITASFFGGGMLGAYPLNEYFWFLAGAIMRMASSSYISNRETVRFAPYRHLHILSTPR